ncbi:MAG: PAS domain S-box protein [Promethearchaeota archaeon]
MINEPILDLQISIFALIGVIIFFLVYTKTRELKYYVPAYPLVPLGYFIYYLHHFDPSFRLVGNLIFFMTIILTMIGTFLEYREVFRMNKLKVNIYPLFFFSFTTIILNGVQLLIIILLIMVCFLQLKIFFKLKTPRHINIMLFQGSGGFSLFNGLLDSFGIVGAWELSYISTILFIAFFIFIPLITYTEKILLKSRERLKESKQEFQVLFNSATSGVAYHEIVYDNKGNPIDYIITNVNPQYEKIISLKRKDVINRKGTEVYLVEPPPYLDVYSRVANTQESLTFETYYAPMNIYFKISVISQKKGIFITVFDDISDRKKAEDAMKSERDKLQAIMDGLTSASIGIDIVTKDYKVLFQNKVLRDRFGDLSGKSCYRKYMGRREPCEICPMREAIKYNKIETFELKGSDGKYYELISAPIPNMSGNIDTAIEIILDITDRKLAEQKVKESEEKYRNIFNDSPIGIFLFDINGILIDGNTTASNTFTGYPIEMSIGKKFTEIIPLFKNSNEILEIFSKRYEEQRKGKKLEPIKFKAIRQDGNVIWIYWQSSTIRLQNKEIIQAVVIDITEQKEAERLIIEENKKLQELSEIRQELITRISHELKTPVTSTYGASQALLEIHQKDMTKDILEFVEIIQRGSKRLKSLVENLLDISRIESNVFELKVNRENLSELIRECVNDLRYYANERDIKINLDLPYESIINIDKIRIGQVITNIVSNAINNTPPKGSVFITIVESKEYNDIIVKDTGIGLTENEKSRLFQKFGKIERFGKGFDVHIEGSGLGLYISKEFVELHGGKIFLESEGRNKGATFTVRLCSNIK